MAYMITTLKYVLAFIAIQIVAFVLAIVGLPICAVLAYRGKFNTGNNFNGTKPIATFPSWAWVWSNDEDGVAPPGYTSAWGTFVWTALRNPANNFRFVRGVSAKGRPLWRKEWGAKNSYGFPNYYAQAGWNGSGFPVLSGGTNENPF